MKKNKSTNFVSFVGDEAQSHRLNNPYADKKSGERVAVTGARRKAGRGALR